MSSFCAACGKTLAVEDKFCPACGRVLSESQGVRIATPAVPIEPPTTSGKAIASLVFGILFFLPFAFLAAIVLGHMGLSEIRKSAGRLKGEGMALTGLVLGYMWIAAIPITLIIAAIAIPNLLRARMAANESSAVGSLRTINAAEIAYAAGHPSAGYTCSFSDLSSLIDSKLAAGQKTGYVFRLSECKTDEHGAAVQYRVTASPLSPNQTGVRAFCSDESAVIKAQDDGSGQRCLESGAPL